MRNPFKISRVDAGVYVVHDRQNGRSLGSIVAGDSARTWIALVDGCSMDFKTLSVAAWAIWDGAVTAIRDDIDAEAAMLAADAETYGVSA